MATLIHRVIVPPPGSGKKRAYRGPLTPDLIAQAVRMEHGRRPASAAEEASLWRAMQAQGWRIEDALYERTRCVEEGCEAPAPFGFTRLTEGGWSGPTAWACGAHVAAGEAFLAGPEVCGTKRDPACEAGTTSGAAAEVERVVPQPRQGALFG